MDKYKIITSCRACNSKRIEKILSLGNQNIVGFTNENTKPVKVPLTLTICTRCKLLQLKQTTNPDLLWHAEYGYRSGINDIMRRELKDIVKKAERIADLKSGNVVIDIGCNDGTLLDSYSKKKVVRVGFDPSHNVISIAYKLLKKYGDNYFKLFVDFFSKEPYLDNFQKKASIITAIAMFYDLDDPNTFLKDVKACLNKDGLFIIQQNYLLGMLNQNAFDNILHEHLEYYSLSSLISLLEKHNLEVFDVSTNNINGGSFRTYIRHRGSKINTKKGKKNISQLLEMENLEGLLEQSTYTDFAKRVKNIGNELTKFLKSEVNNGKVVYVYGASTRGNTLLQFCGIDNKLITAAAERNPYKWGKFTVGTNIPIVSEGEARNAKPDYFLALPWYFKSEFLEREKEFLEKGGKFIFPLPKFEVIGLKDL